MSKEKREIQSQLLGVQAHFDLAVKLFAANDDPRKVKECLTRVREFAGEAVWRLDILKDFPKGR